MLIRFIQQSDKLLFAGYAMARERPKASPVQGEVAKIFDFCRRGCCRSKLPLCRNLCEFEAFSTQSLSQKSKIFDSSLCTREPWALPRQCVKQPFPQGNDTEHPPMVLRQLQAVVTHLQPAMPANNNLSACCVRSISIFRFTQSPGKAGGKHPPSCH